MVRQIVATLLHPENVRPRWYRVLIEARARIDGYVCPHGSIFCVYLFQMTYPDRGFRMPGEEFAVPVGPGWTGGDHAEAIPSH